MLSHTCPLPALLLGPHSSASRAGLSGQRARRLLTHRKSRKEAADPGRREETHPGEQPGVQFPFNGRLPGPGSLCPVLPSHWPSGALGACPAALLSCLSGGGGKTSFPSTSAGDYRELPSAILWNSAFRCLYLPFSPLLFTSLLFTAICKASPDSQQ